MVIPIRTDRQLKSTPWVNYALIAVNVVIFLLTKEQIAASSMVAAPPGGFETLREHYPVVGYYLYPTHPQWSQFITYQFLHGSWMHLIGNMVFLFVFGNSVEDRLGKVGYLAFYLAGGILAGLGHAMVELNSVLGASGAVSAVTGAYLALFPLSNVVIVIWFIMIGAFEVSSVVLICFQIVQNLISELLGLDGVAYLAHLSGYGYGFAIGMLMLYCKILPREPYDMLALIERQKRRAEFRAMTRRGQSPWAHLSPDGVIIDAKDGEALSEEEQRLAGLRRKVSTALAAHDASRATAAYRELLAVDSRQVLTETQQLDVANLLMSQGEYPTAAHAYELFLEKFTRYSQREQIQLILGLIYARYLDEHQRAATLLEAAMPRLADPAQVALAKSTLEEL